MKGFCQKCYEKLNIQSPQCAAIWSKLCDTALRYSNLLLISEMKAPEIQPFLRDLEMMGYIATADGPNCITLRVEGFQHEEPDTDYFCIDTFNHVRK